MRIAHVLSIASLGPTTLALSLGLGAGLLATSGSGCKVQSIFTCVDDTNCQPHGEGGVCEANSFCTFPDAECTTGKRWHDRAGDLAGECFEVDGGSGSGSDGSGGSGSSDDAPTEESGSDSTPVTTAGSSSGEPPDPSTGPAAEDSSSGRARHVRRAVRRCDRLHVLRGDGGRLHVRHDHCDGDDLHGGVHLVRRHVRHGTQQRRGAVHARRGSRV
jgi:hypothetical protein